MHVENRKLSDDLKKDLKLCFTDQIDDYHKWINEVQIRGSYAAWMLGSWDAMEEFVETESYSSSAIDVNLEQNRSFYQAVLAIHKQDYVKATEIVNSTRVSLVESIGVLLDEKYSRANRAMITMQVHLLLIYI